MLIVLELEKQRNKQNTVTVEKKLFYFGGIQFRSPNLS